MGIWDDPLDDEEILNSEPENPYLADPKKGMELIAKLLPNHQKNSADNVARRLDDMLDNEILTTLKDFGGNTIALNRRLMKLSDKIMEYKKIRLLSGKSIVGIVGRFSAGKSGFINSLLNTSDARIVLPEDQNPTTSIPTYIVGGDNEKIQAYSGGRTTDLDLDAMQAMTHRFYEEYGIGFSRFVGNLVIYTPFFPSQQKNRIVFLDTPGYNKPDIDARENMTDEHIAEQQVKAADFLILLVTVDDGIVDKDIDFISRVATKNPLLVVVNKADRKPESDCRAIVENGRRILTDKGINFFGITAYSSHNGKEYLGQNLVEKFLAYASQQSAQNHDVKAELNSLTKFIDDDFDKEIHAAEKRRKDLGNDIYQATDIRAINSLSHIYGRVCQKYGRLRGNRKKFNNIVGKISANFSELMHGE
ncbi:MAG: dynamin family protein [Selenomonadaceae bacterium]|nr:dynamin family protein [Selenomonadaceae bacterium]